MILVKHILTEDTKKGNPAKGMPHERYEQDVLDLKTNKERRRFKLSKISVLHYTKLVFRSALFLAALSIYLVNRINGSGSLFGGFETHPILIVICLVFAVEMVLRFFPSKFESMGCQKQFAASYIPASSAAETTTKPSTKSTLMVAAAWVGLNAILGALYFAGILDAGVLILISLAFSVCDMICILFFCPFQTWFMKNKCCGSCRIYNWDYAMMFTPLVFIKNPYTWSLLILALILLAKWEFVYSRYPERFTEETNDSLSCSSCQEKLCQHKKQLQRFLVQRGLLGKKK